MVVDGVTDPHNLGAVLRSAECAGVTGVVLPRHRAVHLSPAVTKASAGAIEHLAMTVVPGVPSALRQMATLGVWTIGLAGDATIPSTTRPWVTTPWLSSSVRKAAASPPSPASAVTPSSPSLSMGLARAQRIDGSRRRLLRSGSAPGGGEELEQIIALPTPFVNDWQKVSTGDSFRIGTFICD